MAQSSRGMLPSPSKYSKCSKCNSNSITSAPLEGEGIVMEGAAILAVATAAGDSNTPKAGTANTMEPIKQEEGGILSNSKTKDSHGKEASSKISNQCNSKTRDMGMCITMEDAANGNNKAAATTSGRVSNNTVEGE